MDKNTKIVSLPEPKNLNTHHWTNEEKVFKRKDTILEEIKDLDIPFKTALLYKLSKSVFGPFLEELNKKQCQDYVLNENKIQILFWQLKRYNTHDRDIIEGRNRIIHDYLNLLKKAVNDCDIIDLHFLENHLDNLFLDCSFVKQVDCTLQNFQNIIVLTLSGNYIKNISGSYLPRKLKYLELFDNLITDLLSLTRHFPNQILHLGLGRNRLTNDSHFHLFSKSKNFLNLKSLDISDNDIYDLQGVLNSLRELNYLTAFSLEGNPCAVIPEYKNEVLKCLTNLQYLDLTEVLEDDKVVINISSGEKLQPQIIFHCHRILGLPEPPKDKKNIQQFHIEVNLPLLVENQVETEEKPNEKLEDIIQGTDEKASKDSHESIKEKKKGKDKKGKSQTKKAKPEKKPKSPKKGKKKSYYAAVNEYDEKIEKQNIWFKTENVPWSKIIEFPPVFVDVPKNNLTLIRDSFRSIVPVRIIYLKTSLEKPKKKKDKNKTKKDKKSKKGAKNTNSLQKPKSIISLPKTTEECVTETILKKITLASFFCDLKSVNWSDETLDFYWADHKDIGVTALRVNGSVKAIDYDINANPKKIKENKLIKEEMMQNGKPQKEILPNILTCQVGFGLRRL